MFIEPHDVQLRWHLKMLRGLIRDTKEVDERTFVELEEVAGEIDLLLDAQAEKAEWSRLGNRWRDAVLNFESHHPQLAQAVEEVTGILATAGI